MQRQHCSLELEQFLKAGHTRMLQTINNRAIHYIIIINRVCSNYYSQGKIVYAKS